ncbi:MAG TPA: response regulator transcription factor [Albitalea sp.]|uniref:response regulator transcription factor n=1 Tax=Piscinibacter sp. TaxID=1903157 RepID=UPI002ED32F27
MNFVNVRRFRVATFFASQWLDNAVALALETAGMTADRHRNAMSLVSALHAAKADVAIVEDEGEQLASCLSALRFRGMSQVPVLAVGKGSSRHIADALRYGAADYAVIGEAMESLVNRVRARAELAQHSQRPASLEFGGCRLHAESRCLSSDSREMPLTSREFGIAWLLFENGGQVVNLNTLSSQVWGRDVGVAKRTIEQHISRLRAKLAVAHDGARLHVHAVNNVGYRLAMGSGRAAAARKATGGSPQQLLHGFEGHVCSGVCTVGGAVGS